MAGTDLFGWLGALWTKEVPEGTPPTYMMHRFLASDQDFAPACRELFSDVRDPHMLFRTWQGLLSRGRGAPRLQYIAPKKPPAEEALVTRIMEVERLSRSAAEETLEVIRLADQEAEARAHYGVPEDPA